MTSAPPPARESADPRERDGGLGTGALSLGILAVGTGLSGLIWDTDWLGWLGVALGVVGVVVGFVGSRRAFHDRHRSGGASLGGFVLSLVGLVVGAVLVVPGLLGIGTYGEGLTLDECMAQAQGQHEERMCASQHVDEYRARFGDPGTG
ncbi:hypothetical protein EV188_11346 [Actinomycetospora succinea]|uniref:DUF4190 domain-containing protein n=1 Tax=Actinomycetospora succinea TaxID=663603 RepID=A0A4R6UKA8_9PSEU|nr:hypothetical protein [Actinomycetospora succinea]TDQ47301.1 hypothetical protein EV188_11346 [Actinomycetospora succinea]